MSSIERKDEIQHHEAVNMGDRDVNDINDITHNVAHTKVHTSHNGIPSGSRIIIMNPAPLGFGAFALSSFVLGLYNTGLVTSLPEVAIGVAFGYGAMGQFICGICELLIGNMFAATSMLTFSGFFLTYGIMMIPSSGFLTAAVAEGGIQTVQVCMGLVQVGYAIAAFIFLLGTLRQPKLIRLVLLEVFLAFLTGGVGGLTGITNFNIASGWISFILAITAWYVMAALLFTPDITPIKLPFF